MHDEPTPASSVSILDASKLRQNLNDLAGAIGRVVITFNSLEDDLSETLVKLPDGAHDQRLRDTFRASLSFAQRAELLVAVFLQKERTRHELALLRYCVKKLRYYEERRNFIVHASWQTARFGDDELTSKKVTTRGSKGLRTALKPADPIEIDMLVEEIRIFTTLDFMELYRACIGGKVTWVEPHVEKFIPMLQGHVETMRANGI